MKKPTDSKFYVLTGLLILGCFISWQLYFRNFAQKDTVNIHKFPKTIARWTSRELPITEKEYAILETKNAFVREYTSPTDEKVYLFIVYSEHNRKVAHPPEVCYTGGGITILENVRDTVILKEQNRVIDANRLLLEDRAGRQQIVFYWFKVGAAFTSNYWKQQILIALKTLIGKPAGSALIRLSTPVEESKEKAALRIKEFAQLITPEIREYLK